ADQRGLPATPSVAVPGPRSTPKTSVHRNLLNDFRRLAPGPERVNRKPGESSRHGRAAAAPAPRTCPYERAPRVPAADIEAILPGRRTLVLPAKWISGFGERLSLPRLFQTKYGF